MKRTFGLFAALSVLGNGAFAQDEAVLESFSGTRVLTNHSVELLPERTLEFIVAHKFGDIAGASGGLQNFYGFDNLADVRIAFEYGVLDNLDIGLGRNKGVGLITGVIDGYAKYKILQQKQTGMPVNLVFVSSLILPYKAAISDSSSVASYPKFLNRFTFTNQLLVARKFSDRFVLQANVGYNHRNFVDFVDANGLVFAGVSARTRFTKTIGLLVEYNHIFNRPESIVDNYQDPLSVGIEILTGGHSFILNFSNSRALNENIFVPNTTSNWLDGQWRFGFSINRRFKL
ncbi:MAG: DUF5777 family beta-barrel protein [Crocinitomix sp.]|nr:DUF5777 family beta-barrel protein [Crocinitomix sp.]